MLAALLRRNASHAPELLSSDLLDENTFYPTFEKDLNSCGSELIIECPFVTKRRLNQLLPTIEKLKKRKARIVINTRDPHEHDDEYHHEEAHRAIASLQRLGVHVLYTSGHHRKIVVIDRKILYEGSLNVLSQNNSSEIMRRIESVKLAWQMGNDKPLEKELLPANVEVKIDQAKGVVEYYSITGKGKKALTDLSVVSKPLGSTQNSSTQNQN